MKGVKGQVNEEEIYDERFPHLYSEINSFKEKDLMKVLFKDYYTLKNSKLKTEINPFIRLGFYSSDEFNDHNLYSLENSMKTLNIDSYASFKYPKVIPSDEVEKMRKL